MTGIENIELLDSEYFIKNKNNKLYINDTIPELMFFTQKDWICLGFYQTQECAPHIVTADLPSIL